MGFTVLVISRSVRHSLNSCKVVLLVVRTVHTGGSGGYGCTNNGCQGIGGKLSSLLHHLLRQLQVSHAVEVGCL